MINLKGKKLLFMGATDMMKSAVVLSKKLGIYTIVIDYNQNAPAKMVADKSYLISTSDIDKIVEICQIEKVDGVFFGYSELNQYYTLEVCSRLNLPFYANKSQMDILVNKDNFKKFCRKFQIDVVPEYKNNEDYEFPVIVKPVDSYSGKGISICNNIQSVNKAIDIALRESRHGRYLIEKYMSTNEYDIIGVYYSIQNGNIALSSMADRIMYKFDNNRQLNTALIYPSVYLNRYIKYNDSSVKAMIKNMGIENGVIFIEGCVDQNKVYFWEAGFRLCGAEQDIFPEYINKVNIKKMLICHALTGTMSDRNEIKYEDPYFKGLKACNGVIFVGKGTITKVLGIEKIKSIEGLINFSQLRKINDKIEEKDIGTLNQSFARFHVVAKNNREIYKIIENIMQNLIVLDENNRNMIINTFNIKDFYDNKQKYIGKI